MTWFWFTIAAIMFVFGVCQHEQAAYWRNRYKVRFDSEEEREVFQAGE